MEGFRIDITWHGGCLSSVLSSPEKMECRQVGRSIQAPTIANSGVRRLKTRIYSGTLMVVLVVCKKNMWEYLRAVKLFLPLAPHHHREGGVASCTLYNDHDKCPIANVLMTMKGRITTSTTAMLTWRRTVRPSKLSPAATLVNNFSPERAGQLAWSSLS